MEKQQDNNKIVIELQIGCYVSLKDQRRTTVLLTLMMQQQKFFQNPYKTLQTKLLLINRG